MELRVFTEPQQGATYDDLLAVAQEAERLGFGAFFRSDHYLGMGTPGLPGPTDAWLTLAALARETSTIRLGTLMTSATFRHPGPLAISVAQVDQMSGGRVELGLGAGWFAQEHERYAIPFPDTRTRFDRFEEQLAVVTGLWGATGPDGFSFAGEHYTVVDSPGLPKPVQTSGVAGGPPVLIGGGGKRRTPALAARYADEFNVPFMSFDDGQAQVERVRRACEEIGRDPATMTWSTALVLCVAETEAELARRAAAIGREVDELRENGLAGLVPEVVDRIGRYAEAGHDRLYLQTLDLADLDHLRLVAAEVLPAVS
ncbi:LLM class F420-dependent oxidoreductase [Nocardioides sp. TRM66260-LWL]|uniref:LLM class F420-dependent oxidoreductase n=1 Tax=Nocardioides sp. TRM66260-LWL TaxID=2874478 RepID=UPI001CC49AA3|nr:LLM class F420-dependent oxidoreductase [Nocardioides sp. TRM66260-LWL]MBZ5733762.1 LLM class F420-dependent oxidoreductase [Nocardioides sp. TRM66260-LWL]